jgi:hypothetical protein
MSYEDLGALRLAAQECGVTLWRNNSGAWTDPTNGRVIRYGLGNDSAKLNKARKSADLIGIGPEGRFIAIEAKPAGWRYTGTQHEIAQMAFLTHVNRLGGFGMFATTPEEVKWALQREYKAHGKETHVLRGL